jgi:hypothetical protein
MENFLRGHVGAFMRLEPAREVPCRLVRRVEDWIGGGEAGLRDLNLIEKDEKRLKRTANSYHHTRGGKHSPPEIPMPQSEAWEMLAILIRKAFLRAAQLPKQA